MHTHKKKINWLIGEIRTWWIFKLLQEKFYMETIEQYDFLFKTTSVCKIIKND